MSVCYGPGPDGRIKMNFGPINNSGGERRLNVIFSRAKRHMAVVASMRGSEITNVHNEGANHLAGFLRYAEAESVGDQAGAQAILDAQVVDLDGGGPAGAARSVSPVAEQLAEALRRRGLPPETSVGRSSFRIDVAVAGDGDDGRLGILLEPAPGSSVRARCGRGRSARHVRLAHPPGPERLVRRLRPGRRPHHRSPRPIPGRDRMKSG